MATTTAELTQARSLNLFSTRKWRRLQEISLGYSLLAPALILLLVFEFFPLFYGVYISMCDWRITCVKIIGIDNYTRAFDDPAMWHSLWITVTYVVLSVPLQLGIALVIAYLLFQNIRGKEALRVAFFLPYITSTVASAAVWSYLYSPDKGLINTALKSFGGQPLRWLGEPAGIFAMMSKSANIALPSWADGPSLALVALIIYTTWVFVGFDITIFLAGLGNIPSELYDAAKVDGANGWKLFRNVTLPLLSPTTFFLLTV